MNPLNPTINRWYERDPELSRMVHALELMDRTFQLLFCQIIIRVYDNYRRQLRESTRLVELGAEKVTALMKSKSKRRWYDQDPILHKAFNALRMMSIDSQRKLAIRLNTVMDALAYYRFACEHREITEQTDEMAYLVDCILREGEEGGQQYLEQLGLLNLQGFTLPENPLESLKHPSREKLATVEIDTPSTLIIIENDQGLRVNDRTRR